jgi:two-component system, cell cycle sensor histidine kinase and response regulator CckA
VFLMRSMCETRTEVFGRQPLLREVADRLSQGNILIGDDDAGVRRVLQLGFERAGRRVLLACDGQDVLTRFRAHASQVAAVLMDVDMPQMSGLDALEELRRIDPEVRVFLMSGVRRYTPEEIGELGVAGFLPKPFHLLDLVQGVLNELSGCADPTRGRN